MCYLFIFFYSKSTESGLYFLPTLLFNHNLTNKMKRCGRVDGCTTWTLAKRKEKKLDGNYTRMLRAILKKTWRQHPTKAEAVLPLTIHHENYPT